ncbi:hypothetical protein ScPMuIL_016614 [Solemya velum]
MSLAPLVDAGGDVLKLYDMGGIYWQLPPRKTPQEMKAHIDALKYLKIRPDDVFLFTYPKSGTHWIFQILNMLLKRDAELTYGNLKSSMLEFGMREMYESQPPPRISMTHLLPDKLPDNLLTSGNKIIFFSRNPKDVAVSMYYHVVKTPSIEYKGTWENWLSLFMSEKCCFYNWFTVMNKWHDLKFTHPTAPILTIMYEDLLKNTVSEVKRIAHFLDVPTDDELIQRIIHKCGFDQMYTHDMTQNDRTVMTGKIGDWKNHFTVAQNERFDAWFEERIKYTNLKLTFEDDGS